MENNIDLAIKNIEQAIKHLNKEFKGDDKKNFITNLKLTIFKLRKDRGEYKIQ